MGAHSQLESLILSHCRARPLMQLQDVYKLLYQAHMGIGHLVSGEDSALASLEGEVAGIKADQDATADAEAEPLWENISPKDAVGRVNLRPFERLGLNRRMLAQGLHTFSQRPPGNLDHLARDWGAVGDLVKRGSIPFRLEDYEEFTSRIVQQEYPAMHHSRAYREAYKPAYRILSTELFHALFPQEVVR